MKKCLFAFIAAVFGVVPSVAPAQCQSGDCMTEEFAPIECEPLGKGGFIGGSELLLFTLYGRQGAGGNSAVGNNDDYFPAAESIVGGRYWLGYEMADGLGLRARFFHWSDDETYNGAVREQQFQTVDFESTLDMSIKSFDLTGFAGLRYGLVELDGADGGGVGDDYNFDGLGLTLGIDGRRLLYRSISLVGGVRYSVLYGENRFDTVPSVLDNTFLDIFEVRLGTEWEKTLKSGSRMFAGVFWEQQVYGTDSYMPNNIDPESLGDVSLAGPVFSIGFDR